MTYTGESERDSEQPGSVDLSHENGEISHG